MSTTRASALCVLLLILSTVAACEWRGVSGLAGPSFDATGNWVGAEHLTLGNRSETVTIQATLTQTGSLVGGTYATGVGDVGTVAGTVAGSDFTAGTTSTRGAGTCDIAGQITTNGSTITGTLNCSTRGSGTIVLNRS